MFSLLLAVSEEENLFLLFVSLFQWHACKLAKLSS